MSWMSSSLRLPSKEGIMPLRPVSMVERTRSSVADLPLGRSLLSKTPCRSGGTFSRSSLVRPWQPMQCISNRSFPCEMAFARRLSPYEQPEDPDNKQARARQQIVVVLKVERNMVSSYRRLPSAWAIGATVQALRHASRPLRSKHKRVRNKLANDPAYCAPFSVSRQPTALPYCCWFRNAMST